MITVEHLTKCYGDFLAVDDLSFEIEKGHVYGFLGPNGAGKSTTMNIMTGCLSATEGQVRINGYDIFEEPERAKRTIGYLPEQPPLYMNETPLEYLKFVGEAKGIKGREGGEGALGPPDGELFPGGPYHHRRIDCGRPTQAHGQRFDHARLVSGDGLPGDRGGQQAG